MIEEDARVLSVESGLAWVETVRRSSCSSCSRLSGCGMGAVAKLFGERLNRLQATDRIGVEAGDRVVIGIEDSALIRAAFLAYLLPLAALMLGAFAARAAGAEVGVVALIGVMGLALGLLVTGRLTGGASARKRYRPMVLRRQAVRGIGVSGPTLHAARSTPGHSSS